MIVSHKYRFIFLRTEKTGGTSLTSALQNILVDGDLQARLKRPSWAKYSPIHHGALKRDFPQFFGLHPHATARQVRNVIGPKIFDSYFKFAIERNPWDRQVSLYFHREWKRKNLSPNFDRDMRSIIYRNSEYVRLKNWPIYTISDKIVADQILRYEELDEEIPILFSRLGINLRQELPRLRQYSQGRSHYSTYYSRSTKNLVERWYRNEINELGYIFEEIT